MPLRKQHLQKSPARNDFFQPGRPLPTGEKTKLEVVLKCDSKGSVEAITALLANLRLPKLEIDLIQAGVGAVTKQDLLLALTGSRLVLAYGVGVAPRLEQWIKERGVEIRLYNVIYRIVDDLKEIARDLAPAEPEETVTGTCKVIAIFKSGKGVILGCEVQQGAVQVGKSFRIVTAMGPVHSARIESLQVDKNPVREARSGQRVGVKVAGFTGARVGDFIECFDPSAPRKTGWRPEGGIINLKAS